MLSKYPVSIIVPFYNSASYIEKCLNSLLSQSFRDIEYVLVNDNSNDKSVEIVEQVIKKYPSRIKDVKIINHSENRGSSFARNTGISSCNGEYIIQVDSDDFVEYNMVECMYNKAKQENSDIVIADYFLQGKKKVFYRRQIISSSDGKKCTEEMLNGNIIPSVCNKLIKKSLYDENNICFPEGIDMGEDLVTTARLLFYAKKVSKIDMAFLHYVQYNNNSSCKNITEKSINDMQNAIRFLEEFFKKEKVSDQYESSILMCKLLRKNSILTCNDLSLKKKYFNLYPETTSYIFSISSIPIHYKIAFWFYAKKKIHIANFILSIIKIISAFKYE